MCSYSIICIAQRRNVDSLVHDSAEEHLAGKEELRAKANKVESWLKYAGIGWFVLGVATLGVWVAEGIGVM